MSDAADRWTVNLDGATLLGRFVVERMIGGGGMANVYLARDEQLEMPVVVKVPHAAFLAEPGFRERFDRETRDLVSLQHPHIVRVLARGEHEGLPFLVMPFLKGGSLGRRMGGVRRNAMPWEDVRPWIRDVARALDFIHAQGVVHRDIKPDNILFDEYGHAYLSDFGIAKAVGGADTGLTVTGATPGSPAYMAPEQPRTRALTGASDQYSLAATLYEALSGRPTFEGETVVDVLIKKQTELPPHLGDLVPSLPRYVADALMRSLAREPEARHPCCADLAEAMLAPTASTSPTTGVPASPPPAAEAPAAWVEPASNPTPMPARTESVGTTMTLGGGTKAMWIVFAVLLLGGPAVFLLGRAGDGNAGRSTEVADSSPAPEGGGEVEEQPPTPAAMVVGEPAPREAVLGTWIVDRETIRTRLKQADGDARIARMIRRHRAEFEHALRFARELEVHEDGTFEMRASAPDGRALTPVSGTWLLVGRRLRFEPDPRAAAGSPKRASEPFTAELGEGTLLLTQPGVGDTAPQIPLVKKP